MVWRWARDSIDQKCCDSQSQKWNGVETDEMNGLTVVTISQMIQMIPMKWIEKSKVINQTINYLSKKCDQPADGWSVKSQKKKTKILIA